ncbi:MAG: D-alanyl-D-alanine carboxypeptidase family protein [Thiobacillus sp.]
MMMPMFYPLRLFVLMSCFLMSSAWSAIAVPPPPPLAAKSWVLMDAATGNVLVDQQGSVRLPPASLTKLMTSHVAALALQQGRIKETDLVVISEKAWRMGGSKMFVQVGDKIAVKDLMRGIIVQSGNDASVALAEHIAGGEDTFAAMMNQEAKRLGLTNTHFMNATGLPAPEHYSSALDMAKLARAIVLEDPQHYALYAEKEFLWNGIKQPNRNLLLWRDPSVDGLKTGHTEEAGYCLVASAQRNGQRLIAAVFGTASEAARAAETATLLGYGFNFFESRTFYKKGVALANAPVWKGALRTVKVGLTSNLAIIVPRGTATTLTTQMTLKPQLIAPLKAGEVVGKIEIRQGDKVLQKADLVALQGVKEGGFFRRMRDSVRLIF